MPHINHRGNWGVGGQGKGGICEFSALSTQFFYEPKTALKHKSLLIKNKQKIY